MGRGSESFARFVNYSRAERESDLNRIIGRSVVDHECPIPVRHSRKDPGKRPGLVEARENNIYGSDRHLMSVRAYEAINRSNPLRNHDRSSVAYPLYLVERAPALGARECDTVVDARILVVDVDKAVSDVVCSHLRAAGFAVGQEFDGLTASESARRMHADLVVLDRTLPNVDGLALCKAIRLEQGIPVIMLTALAEAADRIDGLEAGADDYVAKPFSPRELVLRVQSVLRRRSGDSAPESTIVVGDFSLDSSARQVTLAGETLALTLREFDLLAFMLTHPRRVFSREDLLRSVWGWEFGDLSTVTVHVRRLREKIESDPAHPTLLHTIWGVGYRFDAVELAVAE
jgi:DNA-binding response OmpR family regulator